MLINGYPKHRYVGKFCTQGNHRNINYFRNKYFHYIKKVNGNINNHGYCGHVCTRKNAGKFSNQCYNGKISDQVKCGHKITVTALGPRVMVVIKVTTVTLLIKVVKNSLKISHKLCLIFVRWKSLEYL